MKDLESNSPIYYDNDNNSGARVQFEATILDHYTSGDAHYYTLGSVGNDGDVYTIKCYGGYSSSPLQSFLGIGNTYKLTAVVSLYNGNYQISGIEYTIGNNSDTNVTLVRENDYYLFDSTHNRLSKKSDTGLNGDLYVTGATILNGSLIIIGSTTVKETNSEKVFTIIINNVSNKDVSYLIGKSISFGGFVNDDNQITLSSLNDITIRS